MFNFVATATFYVILFLYLLLKAIRVTYVKSNLGYKYIISIMYFHTNLIIQSCETQQIKRLLNTLLWRNLIYLEEVNFNRHSEGVAIKVGFEYLKSIVASYELRANPTLIATPFECLLTTNELLNREYHFLELEWEIGI